jgi:hypothetical protein
MANRYCPAIQSSASTAADGYCPVDVASAVSQIVALNVKVAAGEQTSAERVLLEKLKRQEMGGVWK